jgi:hypothetical protein
LRDIAWFRDRNRTSWSRFACGATLTTARIYPPASSRAGADAFDGGSPDRLDALVWAVTELTGRGWSGPRIRLL